MCWVDDCGKDCIGAEIEALESQLTLADALADAVEAEEHQTTSEEYVEGRCIRCWEDWPCPTIRALAAYREARK